MESTFSAASGLSAPFVTQNSLGQWLTAENFGAEQSTPTVPPAPLCKSRDLLTASSPDALTMTDSSRTRSPSAAHKFPFNSPRSFLSHRERSVSRGRMPQQSILKAIASRPPGASAVPSGSLAESLARSLESTKISNNVPSASSLSSAYERSLTPATARLAKISSPCFFHERFDNTIDTNKLMASLQDDDEFTPTRLMRTATFIRNASKQLQRRSVKGAVRSVMIVTKARDNSLVLLTKELATWLLSTPRNGSDVGVNVYVDEKLKASKRFDAAGILASNPKFEGMLKYWNPDMCWSNPELFDLVLTLGGDGTVLYTSFALFQRVVPPVLAFSLGSLGFLTNFEFADYKRSLDRVMGDDGMNINMRMRFTCTVFRADLSRRRKGKFIATDTTDKIEGEQFEVLNELVIDRGPSPYVSNLELYGDDELLTVIQADGCIFSTPTGSTAYSLSAGGPLTHPSIPGIMLTPICPHTLSFRPMVLSDSMMLKVCIPKHSRSTAYASFDGKHRVELRRGDVMQIEAGRFPFPTVASERGASNEWFDSVRRALRWNTRGAVQGSFTSARSNPTGKPGTEVDPVSEYARKMMEEDSDSEQEPEDEEWDINPDPVEPHVGLDSGIGASEVSSVCPSPPTKFT